VREPQERRRNAKTPTYGLVGDDNVAAGYRGVDQFPFDHPVQPGHLNSRPVGLGEDLVGGLELASDDLGGLVGLALLEILANAEDDLDTSLDSGGGL